MWRVNLRIKLEIAGVLVKKIEGWREVWGKKIAEATSGKLWEGKGN
jgi:hypothetical protein